MHRFLTYLLVLALSCQLGLSSILASQQVAQAKAYSTDSAELICTGREMQWIDPFATMQRGEFVFIDAPSDVPDTLQNVHCANGILLDMPCALVATVDMPASVALVQMFSPTLPVVVLQAVYSKALSRGPPAISFS